MALIDNRDAWDAAMIIERSKRQIWDEVLAVECHDLDDTKDVIPSAIVDKIFASSAYALLYRIDARMTSRS